MTAQTTAAVASSHSWHRACTNLRRCTESIWASLGLRCAQVALASAKLRPLLETTAVRALNGAASLLTDDRILAYP